MSDFAGRRVRCVRVADDLLLQILREGLSCSCVQGLPNDAALAGVEHRGRDSGPWPGTVVFYVESVEFAPVPAGEDPPEMDVVFRTLREGYDLAAPIGRAADN